MGPLAGKEKSRGGGRHPSTPCDVDMEMFEAAARDARRRPAGLTLRLALLGCPRFHVDHFDATVLAAFRADLMRSHRRLAGGTHAQRSGLERQVTATAIARPLG